MRPSLKRNVQNTSKRTLDNIRRGVKEEIRIIDIIGFPLLLSKLVQDILPSLGPTHGDPPKTPTGSCSYAAALAVRLAIRFEAPGRPANALEQLQMATDSWFDAFNGHIIGVKAALPSAFVFAIVEFWPLKGASVFHGTALQA